MVYKYYSPQEYNIESIRDEYFWFSRHQSLNDPFDMAGDLFHRFPNFLSTLPSYQSIYQQSIQKYGICCFSHDPLNKHLWALYSSSHTGFVLGFDDTLFIDSLSPSLQARVIYRDCIYRDRYPDFNLDDTLIPMFSNEGTFNEYKNIGSIINSHPMDPKDLDQIFEFYLLIKEKETWRIENEKRLILGQNFVDNLANDLIRPDVCLNLDNCESGYKIKWAQDALKEIYFGYNMDSSTKDTLNSMLSENIDRKKMNIAATGRSFSLIPETCDVTF